MKTWFLIPWVLTIAVGCGPHHIPIPEDALVVMNGTVIDETGMPPMVDGAVVVQGDRIVAVGEAFSFQIPPSARVINAGGGTILPGVINSHTHSTQEAGVRRAFLIDGVTTVCNLDTPPLWGDDDTQSGPVNQNDRHDVKHATQGVSSVKIECADCHDPHTANATSPPFSLVRTDPDPTDGRVPGTGWFADSAAVNGGSGGTDAISEWCLDCHDGSLPAAVQDNRSPQVYDILHGGTSWYGNSHGAGGSSASLKTGANYWGLDMVVSCLACHQTHPDDTAQQITTTLFNNLFLMKDTIHGTDFTTVIPSDGGAYELTTLTLKKDNKPVNGYYLCNTCHVSSMGNVSNCFRCHTHGDGRF